ncbi:hypothetical protein [Citrobacter tructae]|uniref:pPIWI-associating nuclease domain-containing protein n=1 Tax=Citrobacter tructae TaxID=2562449 RepID=UPI00197AA6B6
MKIYGPLKPKLIHSTNRKENGITVAVSGTVYVTQEYGKGEDFTEVHENYPFSIYIEMNVEDPNDITIDQSDFEIDTSSWFGV